MKRLFKNLITLIGGFVICVAIFGLLVFGVLSIYNLVDIHNSRENHPGRISDLEVRVYTENEEGIYYIDYPNYYYKITPEGGGRCIQYEMVNSIQSADISYKDFNYITEYIRELPDSNGQEDSKVAYEITIEYYDDTYSGLQYEHDIGLDEFPPDWDRFIKTVNKICGDDYLAEEGEIIELTPKLLTDWFGVTDEDVKGGTLQDVIEYHYLDISSITESFSMQGALEAYYVSTKEDLIEPYRPTELRSVDSTMEEYDLFIEELLASDENNNWVEKYSSRDGLRRFYSEDTGQSFYLGRTVDFEKIHVDSSHDVFEYEKILFERAHPDPFLNIEASYLVDFVYSPCGKYIFVYETCPELIFDFLEIEAE